MYVPRHPLLRRAYLRPGPRADGRSAFLKEKTGFDVDKALIHIEEEKNEEKAPAAPAANGRRVQPAAPQTTGRRVQPAETPVAPAQEVKPKYVITKKGEEHAE